MKEIKDLSFEWRTGTHQFLLPGNVKILSAYYTNGIKVLYEIDQFQKPEELFIFSLRASEDFLNDKSKFVGTVVHENESIHIFYQ